MGSLIEEHSVHITYDELVEAKVPAPTKLSRDTILLPNGFQLDMNDIYENTLPEAGILDFLSDYETFVVIVLAGILKAPYIIASHIS